MQQRNFLGPLLPGALGRAKRSNIIKSQVLSRFQRFSNQTLCVFSQMKDIKHIRWDFHSTAWVMPQGWDLGVLWGVGQFFFLNSTRVGVWVTYMNGTCNSTIFGVPRHLGPWGRVQRSNIIKSQLLSPFQIFFKPNFVCPLTDESYKYIRQDFQ